MHFDGIPKNLKYIEKCHKIHHFMKSKKNLLAFEYHEILLDFKQSQLNIGFKA